MNKITREKILAEIKKRQEAKKVNENKAVRRPVIKEASRTRRTPSVVSERRFSKGETIQESLRKHTANMSAEQKRQYNVLAENIVKATKTIYSEATQAGLGISGVMGQGAGVGLVKTYFDIFFGYHPHLIVHEIASVQPIPTERAVIFYYQTLAGSNKGKITAGDVLIDPFKVNTDVEYTSSIVTLGDMAGTAEASLAKPAWGPLVPNSARFFDAAGKEYEVTWTGTNAGTVEGKAFTIVESGGNVTVAFDSGVTPARVYTAKYEYDNKYAPTQTPELNANVASIDVTAKARTVKTQYSFQAGFGFEAQFGMTLEDKLAEQAMYELKRETDLDFVFEIMRQAPVKVDWNKAAGVANGLYEFHKLSFMDAVVGASNLIYSTSKRARGNVLLVGTGAQTIVETLPAFKGEDFGSQLGGAKVIGKLKEIKVIAVPELGANDWAVIYKSNDDSLDAGIVFAPYIPVVATPTVMLDDFLARKAYTTSYGKVVVNRDYFVRGSIINNPVAMPIQVLKENGEVIEDFGASE